MEGGEDDNENDKITLLDLPEPVLIHILSYLNVTFLRYVAPKVSVAFRHLSRSQSLWSNTILSFASHDAWEESISEDFIRELKVTPYLRHLCLTCHESLPQVESAVAATRCKIHRLSLHVNNYNPKWVLMLQRHPEIQELDLGDNALDDEFAASVGRTVGAMIPRLISLNVSHTSLLKMPVTGLLLSAFSHQGDIPIKRGADWAPADLARHYPAGSEPTTNSMEVTSVDNHRLDLGGDGDEPEPGRGLQRLTYLPYLPGEGQDTLDTLGEATAAHNLAALILGNCHSLQDVQVDAPHEEVFQALAKCTHLKELSVTCDEHAEAVCAMLEAMAETSLRTLHSLRLVTPPSLRAEDIVIVLRTLVRLEARVDTLTLVGSASSSPTTPLTFPGFSEFAGLLVESGRRREPPCLRVLCLDDMAPVGRLELTELVQLARPGQRPGQRLSLRRLELSDCVCSAERAWGECRDRCDEALKRVLPDLEVETSNRWLGCDDRYDMGYMPLYTCDCERRRAPPHNRRGRGRGGGGRGH